VTNWQVLPWSHADYRETPGAFNSHQTIITVPSDTITLYFGAWKKWAIGAREFLVNYDNLRIFPLSIKFTSQKTWQIFFRSSTNIYQWFRT
jgi:hypothetical protein